MADDVQALTDFVDRWYSVFATGDVAALSALYTPDARLMLANLPAVTGAEAIGAMLGSFTRHVDMAIRHAVADVDLLGDDLAVVTGAGWVESTPKGGGEVHRDASRFVMVMHRDPQAGWRCHYDVSQPTPDVRWPD